MAKKPQDLKLLLVQIRDEQQVRREEHLSFARYAGLAPHQIDILNLFDEPLFELQRADPYDAVLIGGASEANVLEPQRYTFVQQAQALIRYCAGRSQPVFASCFGFQLAVLALGGEILHKDQGFEMGTLPISLTRAAKDDPLFCDIPDGFPAVSVHRQYTLELPPGCELLAYTDQCLHAFRLRDKPFWAFQFHPEVDYQILIERLTFFRQKYTEGDSELDRVLQQAVETPDSNALVTRFVERVLL
ncbi:type 1 glutamine amidotransferase [Marinobacterium jannaschii]|uniref:type 1 glutamine amidotransferase n=1 Tax=Marinobacterium jannaschii TaxID=64970 RepID=UPI0004877310|nr:type 1 glutamine amidotransferase [Marinobacterium jannaschii]